MFVIARVAGHLLRQRPLQHRLGHLRQQPIGAEQLHALGLGFAQQLISQLVIDQRPPGRRVAITLAGTIEVSVITCPSASRIACGSSSGRVTYTAGRTRPTLHRKRGAVWADDFQGQANEYGQAEGDHARPDVRGAIVGVRVRIQGWLVC
jgi:hypothetical protein